MTWFGSQIWGFFSGLSFWEQYSSGLKYSSRSGSTLSFQAPSCYSQLLPYHRSPSVPYFWTCRGSLGGKHHEILHLLLELLLIAISFAALSSRDYEQTQCFAALSFYWFSANTAVKTRMDFAASTFGGDWLAEMREAAYNYRLPAVTVRPLQPVFAAVIFLRQLMTRRSECTLN